VARAVRLGAAGVAALVGLAALKEMDHVSGDPVAQERYTRHK
jgi:hypothetical protein